MKLLGPGQSALLLLEVVKHLDRQRIDYAVVGAMAAAVHGSIRATTDADALLSITLSKLGRLEAVLRTAGFDVELRQGDRDDPIPALLCVSDRHGNQADLLGGLRGFDPQAFSRTVTVPFQGIDLRVIGREDFIAMKCFAGGPLDLMDARAVLRAPDASVDWDLLRRTTRRLGRDAADALETLLSV